MSTRRTSWAEVTRDGRREGLRYGLVPVGEADDPTAPLVSRVVFAPGYVVEPHSHDTDYVEIIVEGSQRVGRDWYHAGDIRTAVAGEVYGPLVAGPEGATVLIIFREARVSKLSPADARARYRGSVSPDSEGRRAGTAQ